MSEHDRTTTSRRDAIGAVSEELAKALTDEGRLIEAGWVALQIAAYPQGVTDEQGRQLRAAFFAGAQHLFSSIMGVLDEDAEPTERDLMRMELIHGELEAWAHEFKRAHGVTDPDIGPEKGAEH